MPPGCVTISPVDGRVFFDTHPMSNPSAVGGPIVFELLKNGSVVPWPSPAMQERLFVAPFGIHADPQGRIWFIEPCVMDRLQTRVLALDIGTGAVLVDCKLPVHLGRVAQDIRVSPDGNYLILADTGIGGLTAASLSVFDIAAQELVRTLWHPPSLDSQDWFVRKKDGHAKKVLWGLLTFRPGLDGIAFFPDGQWLYLGTMVHDTLHRIPTTVLLNLALSHDEVTSSIEAVSAKPINDGIAFTQRGSLLITDVENGGLAVLPKGGQQVKTLTRDENVVWADSVEVFEKTVVFTDSAIAEYLMQDLQPPSPEVVRAAGPFHIYRFQLPEGL